MHGGAAFELVWHSRAGAIGVEQEGGWPGLEHSLQDPLQQIHACEAMANRISAVSILRDILAWQWFRGDYSSWGEALAACHGYADTRILERVRAGTRQVCAGQAAYERDGVAFSAPRSNHPLLAAFFRVAAQSGGRLRIIDFGGALGSLYWQHRASLGNLREIDWRIVEQPHFIEAGRKEFASGALSFWVDLPSAVAAGPVDLILLSGVIQYLAEPYKLLDEVIGAGAEWLFADRLPLLRGRRDRLAIEHVPPEIGEASYPAWFLSRERFEGAMAQRYSVVDSFFTALEGGVLERWNVYGTVAQNQGYLFRRNGDLSRT